MKTAEAFITYTDYLG